MVRLPPHTKPAKAGPQLMLIDGVSDEGPGAEVHQKVPECIAEVLVNRVTSTAGTPEIDG